MAQILAFPSGIALPEPATAPVTAQPAMEAPKRRRSNKPKPPINVVPIRPWGRVPKRSREEDEKTAMIARIAASYRKSSCELAQTEPGSERHRFVQHMAGISHKLPCNNLRVFTTPDDIVEGIWKAWRRVTEVCLEWRLADHRRHSACLSDDRASQAQWEAREKEAEARVWVEYERLIRIPATTLGKVQQYKLDRGFARCIGNLEWMRKYKPDLAAVLDDEIARLTAEKEAGKAARAAKKLPRSTVEA